MKKWNHLKLTALIIFAGLLCFVVSNYAKTPETHAASIREERVIAVTVNSNDTVWSIAKKFHTDECGSLGTYIKQIKKCNSMESNTIYAGYQLIVPIWATDAELPAIQKKAGLQNEPI